MRFSKKNGLCHLETPDGIIVQPTFSGAFRAYLANPKRAVWRNRLVARVETENGAVEFIGSTKQQLEALIQRVSI